MKTKICLIMVWLLFACDSTPSESSEMDASAIDQVYELFSKAYQDLDVTLVDSIYVDDAIYLSPGDSILFGKDQFIGTFRQMFDNSKADSASLDIDFSVKNRQINNDQAVDRGYYHLQRSKSGQPQFTDVGKFITVLKKQSNGQWKFIADGYSQAPVEAWPSEEN
ncbi:MAG: nuclear transport factor 2 family protein [Saprospiraceae bacterium]|nr:nuclear transport factor 2 family protein [Saprospiraceae bacterium]